jgi:hypothetical protein
MNEIFSYNCDFKTGKREIHPAFLTGISDFTPTTSAVKRAWNPAILVFCGTRGEQHGLQVRRKIDTIIVTYRCFSSGTGSTMLMFSGARLKGSARIIINTDCKTSEEERT